MIPLSILDLSLVPEGSTPADALRNSLDLAQHAEQWGYKRFWMAEHHNFPGIASAATAVALAHIGAGTKTIRIGAGGVMLPNHSPLVIAEQFGTLETLHPGRVDLALGRAPGTDGHTILALRRPPDAAERFPHDVLELQEYFAKRAPDEPRPVVQAVPGAGLEVPLWILGSSLFGAGLAAELGLPYAFASHFAPQALLAALETYRERYRPSKRHPHPYAMAGVNVVVADTDAEARRLFTSTQQQFTNLFRGVRQKLQPPLDDIDAYWTPDEKLRTESMLRYSFVGTPATVRAGLTEFIARTGVDEVIVATGVYDHAARLHSCRLLAEVMAGS
jgi:luciferase family oxidoreductase group 1